jgi:hypothetical protein
MKHSTLYLETAALLCRYLHVLRNCATTQKKQIILFLISGFSNAGVMKHSIFLDCLTLEDGTDRLFLGVGNQLTKQCCIDLRSVKISHGY